ncbi:phosphatase PAP2 family protein [Candidatus Saccharibacteria bacterium]|nr:phosphatase PAP2 family protein [Candidatus Saccharibacteria bacterium]
MDWNLITNIILITSFAVLAVFVILGFCQWIKRKSLKKVDKELLWMPLPLALMAATYFIFDKFLILNTRPNGSGEPSFPSTHVMVVATIFALAALILPRYIKSDFILTIFYAIMLTLIIITCVGRVFADMHWVSDVVGALIFALIFAVIYYLIIRRKHHA